MADFAELGLSQTELESLGKDASEVRLHGRASTQEEDGREEMAAAAAVAEGGEGKEGKEGKKGTCTQTELTLDETHVGRRVSIYWPNDRKSYWGVVAAFNEESGTHTVRYDDGDTKKYDMSKRQFALKPVRRPPITLLLPGGYAFKDGKLDLHAVLAHGDRVPRLILDLLLPATLDTDSLPLVESVRVASKGGWMFIERNLRTSPVHWLLGEALLFSETMLGELYKKWIKSSPTGAPATGAEKMALCRGLQQKAAMINLVNELQVSDGRAPLPPRGRAPLPGLPIVNVDAPLTEWKGVMLGAEGQVVAIDFTKRCTGGDIAQLQLPAGTKELNLSGCVKITGDIAKLTLPVGIQTVNFGSCSGLTGDIAQLNLPVGMKSVSFSNCAGRWDKAAGEMKRGVTGDVGKLVLPEGMQTVNFYNCGRLHGDITQLNLPVGMRSVNFQCCGWSREAGPGITGDIGKLVLPEGMQTVNFGVCKRLTGDIGKLVLPEGMQTVNFGDCSGLTGDVTQLRLPGSMQSLDVSCSHGVNKNNRWDPMKITGDLAQLQLPVGMQTVNFRFCQGLIPDLAYHPIGAQREIRRWGLTGNLPPSERAKVKRYSGP